MAAKRYWKNKGKGKFLFAENIRELLTSNKYPSRLL